uniref:RRM domain-containing protein n=1 Tax=Proboscia inermis TaxID=420281 RepID=A0A7S0C8D2_9STRA
MERGVVNVEDVKAHLRAGGMTAREINDADLTIPAFDTKSTKHAIPSVYIDRDVGELIPGKKSPSVSQAPSRGFGFVEFQHHVHALAVLRELNNNPKYSEEYVNKGKKAKALVLGGKNSKKNKKQKVLKKDKADEEEGKQGGPAELKGDDGKIKYPRLLVEFTVENKAKARTQAVNKAKQATNTQKQKKDQRREKRKKEQEEKEKAESKTAKRQKGDKSVEPEIVPKKKSRGALQREKKRLAKELSEADGEDAERIQAKQKEEAPLLPPVPEAKPTKKALKKMKKKQTIDREGEALEKMVQSYKASLFSSKDSEKTEAAPQSNPRETVKENRWFEQ